MYSKLYNGSVKTGLASGFQKSRYKLQSQRSNSKFVKDRLNVFHDSLLNAYSLSASSLGKKNTFLGIIILIFFACALSHYREVTIHHVTLKTSLNIRQTRKVFASLK